MIGEFRTFLLRGNVIDLAVGLIAGSVFGAVVNSLVKDVVMPFVTAIVGEPDYTSLVLTLNGSEIRYGSFLTALITFLLTMAAVFFCIVKPVNVMTARIAPDEPVKHPAQRECPECLAEIPTQARRCRYCTSQVPAATV